MYCRMRAVRRCVRRSVPLMRRNFLVVINQKQVGYREFLGGNRVKLEPGIHLDLPIFHSVKVVDTREGSISIEEISAYTKDNVPVIVGGTLFYIIEDPEKACYGVQDYLQSVHAVGRSAMRAIVGGTDYDEFTGARNDINDNLSKNIGDGIKEWGVRCSRFEVQGFHPQNATVAKQLELQMEAERRRRENELVTQAKIRTAGGEREAAIIKSQGFLVAQENEAKAHFIMEQQKADAAKYTIDVETTAMAKQIETLGEQFDGDRIRAAQFIIELERLRNMGQIAAGPGNSTYFMQGDWTFPAASAMLGDMLRR